MVADNVEATPAASARSMVPPSFFMDMILCTMGSNNRNSPATAKKDN